MTIEGAAACLGMTAGGVIVAARGISGFSLPHLEQGLPLMLLEATVARAIALRQFQRRAL